MITCGLAEDAVTATEQEAVVPPPPTSGHVELGLNVSVGTDDVKDTDPVGGVAAPAAVFVTVTVTVEGCPTTTEPLENPIDAEVERAFTVRLAPAVEDWCVALAGYVAVIG